LKAIDRLLQRWRIGMVRSWIRPGDRLLDVGCADGALFRQVPGMADYVGIDPEAPEVPARPGFRLVRGHFPADLPGQAPFDVVTMLAALEHVPQESHLALAATCRDCLRPGGLLALTIPGPAVDHILDLLKAVRVIDGMETGQHYGFDPARTREPFGSVGFELVLHRRFQFGLNNLFVFRRPG
jgi:SAM-dependent methyltransferase